MIYLDNAATSWPKPPEVIAALAGFFETPQGNPGRGGHSVSQGGMNRIENLREALARFFGAPPGARVIFTTNATEALNLALQGIPEPGDRVVTTDLEHNSVLRPLHQLRKRGVEVVVLPFRGDPEGFLTAVAEALARPTRLVVTTHGSNVTGEVLPVAEIGRLAHAAGVLYLVDAAQTAGVLPIDMARMQIDLLASPGHKGLMGPPGTGFLVAAADVALRPLRLGGTGTRSEEVEQPLDTAAGYEAGTVNSLGLAGLAAGLDFVTGTGTEVIAAHETRLVNRLLNGLGTIPGVTVYGPGPGARRLGVASCNLPGVNSEQVSYILDTVFQVVVRAGLHCAPLVHRRFGTLEVGMVRFSPGWYNTEEDIDRALAAVEAIARERTR